MLATSLLTKSNPCPAAPLTRFLQPPRTILIPQLLGLATKQHSIEELGKFPQLAIPNLVVIRPLRRVLNLLILTVTRLQLLLTPQGLRLQPQASLNLQLLFLKFKQMTENPRLGQLSPPPLWKLKVLPQNVTDPLKRRM